MPPETRRAPDIGVSHLDCFRRLMTAVRDSVAVAAAREGQHKTPCLRQQVLTPSVRCKPTMEAKLCISIAHVSSPTSRGVT